MRRSALRLAAMSVAAFALASCKFEDGSGFVQIKTVPAIPLAQPVLYLDSVKLEALKKGEAIFTRRAGTIKLQVDGPGGNLAAICEVVVRKNRITTVTISTTERPPRCQCRTDAAADPKSGRVCIA